MNNKATLYGIIGFLVGVLLTVFYTTGVVNSNNTSMMKMMGIKSNTQPPMPSIKNGQHLMPDGTVMNNNGHDSMTMDEMVDMLKGKSGDKFDKAFIDGMIEHHQGAIDMAELAKEYAGHNEIKQMADEIISAQSREIDMMRQWKEDWGL